MRVTLAIFIALLIFLFSWLLNAGLMMGIGLLGTGAGIKSGILFFFNTLLTWILSPGLGSGVALYAVGKKFHDININLIFVGFTSIVVTLLFIMLAFSISVYSSQDISFWELLLFLAQGASVLVGARIGRNLINGECIKRKGFSK